MADAELLRVMGPELEVLLPVLDEKGRRLVLGAVARAAGDGGVTAVANVTGAAWQTVAGGAAELGSGGCGAGGGGARAGRGAQEARGYGSGAGAGAAGAGGGFHAGGSGVAVAVDDEKRGEAVGCADGGGAPVQPADVLAAAG